MLLKSSERACPILTRNLLLIKNVSKYRNLHVSMQNMKTINPWRPHYWKRTKWAKRCLIIMATVLFRKYIAAYSEWRKTSARNKAVSCAVAILLFQSCWRLERASKSSNCTFQEILFLGCFQNCRSHTNVVWDKQGKGCPVSLFFLFFCMSNRGFQKHIKMLSLSLCLSYLCMWWVDLISQCTYGKCSRVFSSLTYWKRTWI